MIAMTLKKDGTVVKFDNREIGKLFKSMKQ